MQLLAKLPEGPLDIIGDIHGEIGVLRTLLDTLGYDEHGVHPQNRRLVFVGDLVDRGPDSPAVLRLVRHLVETGRAQCVLGNHELNLLCNERKQGNSWWTAPGEKSGTPMTAVDEAERPGFVDFLKSLPLLLERDDLRVVHACWHAASIELLREHICAASDVLAVYRHFEHTIERKLKDEQLLEKAKKEAAPHEGTKAEPNRAPDFMPVKAEIDTLKQMGNPIRVLTSGEETPTDQVFRAGGKWRMVRRVKWWEHYDDSVPVIVGHYWRRYAQAGPNEKNGPDLFKDIGPHQWAGKRRNVYCVDFSIGARSTCAVLGKASEHCRLAAIRMPEREVVFDHGDRMKLEAP